MPKFDCSILLPVRPNSTYLSRCVEALLGQTNGRWQLVAVLDRDDGQNQQILKNKVPELQLRMVHADIRDGGLSALLNTGLRECDANLVMRIDDDDITTVDRVERQVDAFENEPCLVLCTGLAKVVDPSGDFLYWIKPPTADLEIKKSLLRTNVIAHSSVMYRKSVVEGIGGYRVNMYGCEDYDLWLRMFRSGTFGGIPHPLVTYMQNPDGLSKKGIPRSSFVNLSVSWKQGAQLVERSTARRLILHNIWKKTIKPE